MFNILRSLIQKRENKIKGNTATFPAKVKNSLPDDLNGKPPSASFTQTNQYKQYVDKIMKGNEIELIQKHFHSTNQDLKKLEKIVSDLYGKMASEYDPVIRIFRWDGAVILQKGKAIPSYKESFSFDTPTGEYIFEIGVSPKANQKEKYRLLWLGLDYAGKTSIINRLQYNEFKSQSRTIGQDIDDFIVEGIRITTIDLGGQKALRRYWENVPIKPQLIMYVIDIADHGRLNEALYELKTRIIDNPNYKNIPVLIVLNKIDLLENQDLADIIAYDLKLGEIMDVRTWQVISVSAKTGSNINELVYTMADMLKGYEVN